MSEFINGDLLSSLEVYYEKVGGYDSLSWRNLLLRRKNIERGRQGRIGKLSLGNISTTGFPGKESGRYYSSWGFPKFHFIPERKFPF